MSMISCGKNSGDKLDLGFIKSYKDIPGVTEEEIAAVESLKATRESFSYGHLTETEAFILPDGTYAGFTAKFCELLSNIFGIEFVQKFCEWDELKDGLDNRRIDFTGDLTPTAERLQFYYMTPPMAERTQRIYSLAGTNEKIVLESDVNGLKLGFLRGSIDDEAVQKCYPSLVFDVVEIDNFAVAAEQLQSGAIDAFVTEGVVDPVFAAYDFISSKEFFPLAYTPVSLATANPDLAPIISVVSKYLAAGGIDHLYELYKEGDYEYVKYKLNNSFTDEEKAYLADLAAREAKVSIAFERDNYPVCFYNEEDGEFQGLALDILAEISGLTDIQFEVTTGKDPDWAEVLEKLKSGEVSMVTQLLYSEARKDYFIWSEVPYASSYYALLSRDDYPNLAIYQVARETVGTIKNSVHETLYHTWFPDSYKTISYETQIEGFAALEKGKIDLLMASEYMLLRQVNYREKPGYKVNIRFNTPMDSFFGFNKNEEILCSIISKTQAYVKTQSITDEWTNRVFDYSKKLATERMYYLMVFVAVLFFVLIGAIYLLVKNKRLSKILEEIACTDGLTGIINRRHFMDLALRQFERSVRSKKESFIMIFDLDHFKKVNDNYGHLAGDKVLKEVAQRVERAIRPYDLFARYGGEEFIILVADVDKINAQNLAERIRLNICQTPINVGGVPITVSASFGVAVATPLNDLDTAIGLADKALYQAKEEGRNRVVFSA